MSKTKGLLITTPLILLFIFQPLFAQTIYPTYEDIYVNDFADVIDQTDEASIRTAFSEWHAETGVEATVLTINSFRDYDTNDETFEAFATNLFNDWGIGSSDTHDGILLLIGVEDRMVRIEVGTAYENSHNTAMKQIIDNTILPQFRNGNMSLGIRLGSLDIVNHFNPQTSTSNNNSASNNGNSNVNSTPTAINIPINGESFLGILCGGGLFFGGFGLLGAISFGIIRVFSYLFSYQRNRKRNCENCGTEMIRLSETADDEFLSEGQRAEEILGSVDYDVWQCPHCHEHELHQYAAWFTSYSRCPQCTHKTLASKSWVTKHPTYTSTGTRKTKKTCNHCDYTRTSTSTIPKKVRTETSSSSSGFSSGRSSGSSSRSFGGGSSSGGGASGKW